jgi:DNA-binding NtrC family response regulator
MYIIIIMIKTNVLVADDYMGSHRLMSDVLEINFKAVRVERAVSLQSFWAKLPAPPEDQPWHLVFLSADLVKEEPEGLMDRVKAANPDVIGKMIIVGTAADAESLEDDVKAVPFLIKPFSLDRFEELIKQVCG